MSGTEERPFFSLGPYILQTLLLLIAPTLYAASIYMALGRIVLATDGEAYCWIRRKWLTKIFLLGDIISFTMQGAGTYKATCGFRVIRLPLTCFPLPSNRRGR
jgi:hypothetical protein